MCNRNFGHVFCLIKAIEVEPLLRGGLLECVIICRANSESVAHCTVKRREYQHTIIL